MCWYSIFFLLLFFVLIPKSLNFEFRLPFVMKFVENFIASYCEVLIRICKQWKWANKNHAKIKLIEITWMNVNSQSMDCIFNYKNFQKPYINWLGWIWLVKCHCAKFFHWIMQCCSSMKWIFPKRTSFGVLYQTKHYYAKLLKPKTHWYKLCSTQHNKNNKPNRSIFQVK